MSETDRQALREFRRATATDICAVCGLFPARWLASHHVMEAQELRRRDVNEWDTRNALAVCRECHANHHSTRRIPLSALTEANWTFAREVLGEAAEDYLRARYRPEED